MRVGEASAEDRYVLVADLLGFSGIAENANEEDLGHYISDWAAMCRRLRDKFISELDDPYFISDTVFVVAKDSEAGVNALVTYARELIERGYMSRFLVRGAIAHGRVTTSGAFPAGPGIIRAHRIGEGSNWVGVTVDEEVVTRSDGLYGWDRLVRYPVPPRKPTETVTMYAVVAWDVPPFDALLQAFAGIAAYRHQGASPRMTWDVAFKLQNTAEFGAHLRLGAARDLRPQDDNVVLPFELAASHIDEQLGVRPVVPPPVDVRELPIDVTDRPRIDLSATPPPYRPGL